MRKYQVILLLLGIYNTLFVSCDIMNTNEKYQRPEWLPGKLYTTVTLQKELGLFAQCLRITGLDTIIDVSGSWTAFAPSDEAVRQYLAENNYSSVLDIPKTKLERIVKFHIIQDSWTLAQLKTMGLNGWRIKEDANPDSYAFKYQTILQNPNQKYWIKKGYKQQAIVPDSTMADCYKMVYTESRKYVPIFYDRYFTVNGLNAEDYNYYFNRIFEGGNVYYADAKLIHTDIFAENGFVHIIDKMVNPMLNAQELLAGKMPGESYQLFLDLLNWYYADFEPNMVATNKQPVIKLGGIADTLFDMNYGSLAFNIQRERFNIVNQTLIKHNGLIAPTDDSFTKFMDGILTSKSGFPHWKDYKSLPADVVDIILGPMVKSSPFYPSKSQYRKVFKDANRYRQNEEDIIRKYFGSNSTFIGLKYYTPDRVFTSVTGPVFCRPIFSIFRQAMVSSGAHDVIATHKGPLYFFPITDNTIAADSSLIMHWNEWSRSYYFQTYNKYEHRMIGLSNRSVSNMILNQVGISAGIGADNKEIINTLGGKTLTWDHSNNTIQGTYPSTFGYKGTEVVIISPVPLDEPADNGKSLTVQSWFNFEN